jgi:hypothetical protein
MLMQIADLQVSSVAASVTESPKTWNPVIVAGALRKVVNGLFDPYRPELHYMRGPGPRWREKRVRRRKQARMTAMRPLALLLLVLPASALAEERPPLIDTNPPYVQVVVTACPPAETPLEPTNQGKSYENERGMTRAERTTYFREIGCIEVPIPPEWMTQELSYRQCAGPAGYLLSMQYLEQNATLVRTRAVGQWACIPGGTPFVGVASQ